MNVQKAKERKAYLVLLKRQISDFIVVFKGRYQRFPWSQINKVSKMNLNSDTAIIVNGTDYTVKELIKEINKMKSSLQTKMKATSYNYILRAYIKDGARVEGDSLKNTYNVYKEQLELSFKQSRNDLLFCVEGLKQLNKALKVIPVKESTDNEKETVNTVIFDFGSVLVKNTSRDCVKQSGIPEEYIEELAYVYFSNAHGISETMSIPELTNYYKEKLKPELRKYAFKALMLFASSKKAFDYTVPMLKTLKDKGYKLYYLSNWNKSSFELCKRKGIFDFIKNFDGGVVSYKVNATKPGEKIYKILIKKYNLNPKECIFYDDKKENVMTAEKLGMKGIVFTQDTVNDIRKLPNVKEIIKESANDDSDPKQKILNDFTSFVNSEVKSDELFKQINPLKKCMIHKFKNSERMLLLATYNSHNLTKDDNNKVEDKLSKNILYDGKKVVFKCCYLPGDIFLYIDLPKTIEEKSDLDLINDIVTESTYKFGLYRKVYHISDKNMDNEILTPRIPDNYFTKNGYEENKTKRICFAPSIDKCVMAIQQKYPEKEFYVHIPIDAKLVKATDVPDAKITGEVWSTKNTKVKCIGKIKLIKDKGLDGHTFSYGDNKSAELYDWEWEWVEKYDKPVKESDDIFIPKYVETEKEILINHNTFTESTHKTGLLRKLYHLSEKNLDGKVLHPRVPENKLTKIGLEDGTIPRVCFAPNIDRCLMALSQNLKDKEFYVHIPSIKIPYRDVSNKQVPDAKVTKEKWVTIDVELKCIGKIKVHEAQDKQYYFKYAKKDIVKKHEMNPKDCTYKWNWEWIEKYNKSVKESYYEESCKDLNAARELTNKVKNLAKEYDANFYFVTDGASATKNDGNKAVLTARTAVAEWERENGYDDKEDWSSNPKDFSKYKLKKENIRESNILEERVHIDTALINHKLYKGNIKLYHFTHKNLDTIKPMTLNAGNKLALPRYSSWWTPLDEQSAWVLFTSIKAHFPEDKWKGYIWGVDEVDTSIGRIRITIPIILDSFYKKHKSFIDNFKVYKYTKTFKGNEIGLGTEYSVPEYTCDKEVIPDKKEIIIGKDMSIRIVNQEEFDKYADVFNKMKQSGKHLCEMINSDKPWYYYNFDIDQKIKKIYSKIIPNTKTYNDTDRLNESCSIIEESSNSSKLIPGFKKKTGKRFKFFDLSDNQAFEYMKRDDNLTDKRKKFIADSFKGCIAVDIETDRYAGYVFITKKDNTISPIWVFKEYQGYGLGDMLLNKAIKKYDANGLWVYKDNKVAIHLYKKYGFIETSHIEKRKDGELIFMDLRNSKCIKESVYEKPYSYDEIIKNYGKEIADRLMKDPAHKFRAETGIELIHREPSKKELKRIHSNWNKMDKSMKEKSDKESMKLFGINNIDHYNELIKESVIDDSSLYIERSHGLLKNSFRIITDEKTGHKVKLIFDLKTDDIVNTGHCIGSKPKNFSEIKNRVRKDGNNTFSSKSKLLAIIDTKTGEKLNSVEGTGPICTNSKPIKYVVGQKENIPTFKSTSGKTMKNGQYQASKENLQVQFDNKQIPFIPNNTAHITKARHLETNGKGQDLDKYTDRSINRMHNDNNIRKKKANQIVKESASDETLEDIISLNQKLTNFEYIIPNNGDIITKIKSDDFYKYYKMLTPKEFVKYNGGICWDYVAYESELFKKDYPDIHFETFYFIMKDGKNDPTHTFLIFKLKNKWYWFEASWKSNAGIYEFNNKSDALSYICKELRASCKSDIKQTFLIPYDALDKKLFGMNMMKYMNYFEEKIKNKKYISFNIYSKNKPIIINKSKVTVNESINLILEQNKTRK